MGLQHSWLSLPFAAAFGSAFVLPRSQQTQNASMSSNSLFTRLDDDGSFESDDLSFITSMAAIGDSYSAGIGAGSRLGSVLNALDPTSDYACSRYDGSYPYLINEDDRLGDPSNRVFQFASCSGALTADVINTQIPSISSGQQVILLSAGGNDVGLTDILNQCIFQWATLNAQQVAVAKAAALADPQYDWAKDFDFDKLGLGCEAQLAASQAIIDSTAFSASLDSVISAAKAKLGSGGTIYYTGYAKFFAEDMSADCDTVSWSTWIYKAYNLFQGDQYLISAHRTLMNQLVDNVNAKLAAAVNRAGSNVVWVNYDKYVGQFGGRYCEAGVDESTTESNTRTGLMFYELNSLDPAGSTPWKRSDDSAIEDTFQGNQDIFVEITRLVDPDAQLSNEDLVTDDSSLTTAAAFNSEAVESTDATTLTVPNLLPDGYGRVFHPQILLHQIIANLVMFHMSDRNGQANGYPGLAEDAFPGSCTYIPPSSGGDDTGGGVCTGDCTDPNSLLNMQVALASYINPLASPADWTRMVGYDKSHLSILVANVLNGPDSVVDKNWAKVISAATSSGKTVIGYVRTGYLGVSQQAFTTRMGYSSLSTWTAQIEEDVDTWYKLYPTIGGIFFDEGWNSCGDNNEYSELYRYINEYTKRKYPGAYTVLNPGATMPQCFEHSADTLMTFESSYESYTGGNYVSNGWTPTDPRKIWHIIYNVPQSAIAEVTTLARQRGAGMIDITDDNLPNPYDVLPNDAYMQELLSSVSGGRPAIANPLPYSGGSAVSAPYNVGANLPDYTSVGLTWALPFTGTPIGYNIYLNHDYSTPHASVLAPPVTLGGFQPGTSSLVFEVTAIAGDGTESALSDSTTASTASLPNGGRTITGVSLSPGTLQTTYTATILEPYAFQRVFLWAGDGLDTGCDPTSVPAWPINYSETAFVCAYYMLEGTTVYKYSGVVTVDPITLQSSIPWAWTSVATATVEQFTSLWRFTLPLGTENSDLSFNFLIQVQGYGPLQNYIQPCPSFPIDSDYAYCNS